MLPYPVGWLMAFAGAILTSIRSALMIDPFQEFVSWSILPLARLGDGTRDPWRRSEYLDAIKFIPLDANGDWHLTLGGDDAHAHCKFSSGPLKLRHASD